MAANEQESVRAGRALVLAALKAPPGRLPKAQSLDYCNVAAVAVLVQTILDGLCCQHERAGALGMGIVWASGILQRLGPCNEVSEAFERWQQEETALASMSR